MPRHYSVDELSSLVAECDIEKNPSKRAHFNVYRTEYIASVPMGNGLNLTVRAQCLQLTQNKGGINGYRDTRPSFKEWLFNPYSGRYNYETHPTADEMKKVSCVHRRLTQEESKQLFKAMRKSHQQKI